MKKFRVIVAGSRDFDNFETMCLRLDYLLSNKKEDHEIIIISGTAKGADKLGEAYAAQRGYEVEKYPANWDKYGRSAGYRRNCEMAEVADACVCFIVNNSKGSTHMANIAEEKGLLTKVFNFGFE